MLLIMQRSRGFTLIELLAALVVMSLMALMCWRAIDAMARTHSQVQQRTIYVQRLQLTLAQWKSDLSAVVDTGAMPPLSFDGRALTLIRTVTQADFSSAGIRLVLWTRSRAATDGANTRWVRWQSSLLTNIFEVYEAQNRADQWIASGADPARAHILDSAVGLLSTADWRLIYYRGNSWVNPLSSEGNSADQQAVHLESSTPDAIRLELTLPAEHGLAGTLTQDWINPMMSKAVP